ncbi:MAG: TlpA disulfide reductase family protein [Thermoanaerobaculia bacterium]
MTRSGTQLYLAIAIGLSSTVVSAVARASEPTSCDEDCPHEYGPIQQVAVSELSPESKAIVEDFLAGFSGPTLSGGSVDARARAGRSRVLLLSIFAEWCCNCRMEAPELVQLTQTWGRHGFAVIGRSEYSAPIEVRRHVREFGVSWPVVLGSRNPDPENQDRVRTTTAHHRLSRLFGSERKWSTPYNVLVVDGDFDTLYVADGEYEPGALEEFLAEHLDTAPEPPAADAP